MRSRKLNNDWANSSLRNRLTIGVLVLSAIGFVGAGVGSQALLRNYFWTSNRDVEYFCRGSLYSETYYSKQYFQFYHRDLQASSQVYICLCPRLIKDPSLSLQPDGSHGLTIAH